MHHKYLLLAGLLLGVGSPVAAQTVKSGIEAWQHSDYDKAVKIWRPLAEQGDPDAQFNLAQAYRLGRGVPTNLAAAQIWLERAATQGHLDAQTTLGLLLFQNGDRANGIRWLKAAAEKNDPRAMLVYGTALFNGDTVTQNAALGYAYVSRAAAQGLAPAKATLGQMNQVMSAADRKKAGELIAAAKTDEKRAAAAKADGSRRDDSKAAAAKTDEVKTAAAKPAPEKPAPAKTESANAQPAKAQPTKAAAAKGGATAATASAAPAKEAAAKEPAAKPATKTARAPAGSWRIQLGAFSQRSSAEALFRKLSGSAPVSGRSPSYSAAGAMTRLQVGPFSSKAAADQACRDLSARGQACFPVPGK